MHGYWPGNTHCWGMSGVGFQCSKPSTEFQGKALAYFSVLVPSGRSLSACCAARSWGKNCESRLLTAKADAKLGSIWDSVSRTSAVLNKDSSYTLCRLKYGPSYWGSPDIGVGLKALCVGNGLRGGASRNPSGRVRSLRPKLNSFFLPQQKASLPFWHCLQLRWGWHEQLFLSCLLHCILLCLKWGAVLFHLFSLAFVKVFLCLNNYTNWCFGGEMTVVGTYSAILPHHIVSPIKKGVGES